MKATEMEALLALIEGQLPGDTPIAGMALDNRGLFIRMKDGSLFLLTAEKVDGRMRVV